MMRRLHIATIIACLLNDAVTASIVKRSRRTGISVDAAGKVVAEEQQLDEPEEPCDDFDLDAALQTSGSHPDVPAHLPHTISMKKEHGDKFAHNLVKMMNATEAEDVDPFYTDLVTVYSMALWNLTNYSVMVKTAHTATENKKLFHKIGADVSADHKLLHDQVAHLYEVMQTSPWENKTIQKHCNMGDFKNFEKCLSIGLCLLRKGVQEKQISSESFDVVNELNTRYLSGNHHAVKAYVKKTKPDGFEQHGGLDIKMCDKFIASNPLNPNPDPWFGKELLESDGELAGRRRRRWTGRRRRRLFHSVTHVVHKAEHAAKSVEKEATKTVKTIKNAAEYGAKAIKTVAGEAIHAIEGLFDCIGKTSNMAESGYDRGFELVEGVPVEMKIGVALKGEVGKDVHLKEIWEAVLRKKNVDHLEFSLEGTLTVSLGVGVDAGVVSADAGVGAEAALVYDHPADKEAEVNVEFKVGAMAGEAVLSSLCLFGPDFAGLDCKVGIEKAVSIMCCEVNFFTGHHECR